MNNDLIAAANVLADLLADENAALTALDLPRAAAMLPDKQRAAADFAAAQSVRIEPAQREAAERVGKRLRILVQDNRGLLERAIIVQGRVIGVIARAAAPAVASPGYGSRGAPCRAVRPVAFAVSARA